jgi:mRNA interferase HigB
MRIIARRTLREFAESRRASADYEAVKGALDAWFDEARRANWRGMADLKRQYRSASIIDAERVVFNIKGNDYRLIVAADFEKAAIWIKWIGSHRDYDRIDARTIDHER